jgi:hypothetical protein
LAFEATRFAAMKVLRVFMELNVFLIGIQCKT